MLLSLGGASSCHRRRVLELVATHKELLVGSGAREWMGSGSCSSSSLSLVANWVLQSQTKHGVAGGQGGPCAWQRQCFDMRLISAAVTEVYVKEAPAVFDAAHDSHVMGWEIWLSTTTPRETTASKLEVHQFNPFQAQPSTLKA